MTAIYSPAVACLFCEDIRQEASGQTSMIGVFPTRISVAEFPFTLPKMMVYGFVRTKLESPPQSITIKLITPWDESPIVIDGPSNEWMQDEAGESLQHDDTAFF